jgi:hypothetical protein
VRIDPFHFLPVAYHLIRSSDGREEAPNHGRNGNSSPD